MHLEDFLANYAKDLFLNIIKDEDFDIKIFYKSREIVEKDKPTEIKKKKILPDNEIESLFEKHSRIPYYIIINHKQAELIAKKNKNLIPVKLYSNILWTWDLIEGFKNNLDWGIFSRFPFVLWDSIKIIEYQEHLNFKHLSYNPAISFDMPLLEKFKDRWDWNGLSGNYAVANQIPNIIISFLNHPNVIWINKPEHDYGYKYSGLNSVYYKAIPNLNESIYGSDTSNIKSIFNIYPCVSTNPGIYWSKQLFEKYYKELDFWLLSLFGRISKEVIKDSFEKLEENRIVHTAFTRSSDYRDNHPVYQTAMENLFENENFSIDYELLQYFAHKVIKVIRHKGNASVGHTPYTKYLNARDLIEYEKLNLSFDEFVSYFELLPKDYLGKPYIDYTAYKNIIKPELLKNERLLIRILKRI